jgi:hypothetical protein
MTDAVPPLPEPPEGGFGALGNPIPLARFERGRPELTPEEMTAIIQVATALLEEAYVHLTLKRAIHAANPLDRLRVLGWRVRDMQADPPLDWLSESEFHDEMFSIFAALQDLHTIYILPKPYRKSVAFIPFKVEQCWDADRSAFVVTRIHDSVQHPDFVRGVELTHWNEIPIDRAVEIQARRAGGSNRFARQARGVSTLTFRWLGAGPPPDEHFVTVRYVAADGQSRTLQFPWWVAQRPERGLGSDERPVQFEDQGMDDEGEWIRQIKQELFHHLPDAAPEAQGLLPQIFYSKELPAPDGGEPFGYLKVFTFNLQDDGLFISEARSILEELPPRGLVLDIRGNPGGNVVAAERLLRLMSDEPIEPEPMQFRNTHLTKAIAANPEFTPGDEERRVLVEASIRVGRYTGEMFSRGFPLGLPEVYEEDGRSYPGPVVLVVDALSYSAADTFAAGFQDNELGHVLGTSGRTGAGGGNVWTLEQVESYVPKEWPDLPEDASFSLAVRRSLRVRRRAEDPLEDLGVEPDELHEERPDHPVRVLPTRRDVIDDDADLLDKAIAILEAPEPAATGAPGRSTS